MMMMMMMMMMVGVSVMMGSHALTCYQCEGSASGVNLTTMYAAGVKCFDESLETETCEAENYCAKHWNIQCWACTINHSFLVVLVLV